MQTTIKVIFTAAILIAGFAPDLAPAQSVPAAINFQGTLYDPAASGGSGGPLTGIQQVQFRIYDAASSGTLVWGRQFPVSCNSAGIFNILLTDDGTWLGGTITDLRSAFEGPSRYLELTVVGHGGAIAPRQQLVSAPYAMHAQQATYAQASSQGFTVANSLTVSAGGAQITGALGVSDNITASRNLTVAQGLSVGNGLAVSNGGAVIKGQVTADSLQVNGAITNAGGANVAGVALSGTGLTLANGQSVKFDNGGGTYHNIQQGTSSGKTYLNVASQGANGDIQLVATDAINLIAPNGTSNSANLAVGGTLTVNKSGMLGGFVHIGNFGGNTGNYTAQTDGFVMLSMYHDNGDVYCGLEYVGTPLAFWCYKTHWQPSDSRVFPVAKGDTIKLHVADGQVGFYWRPLGSGGLQ